LALLVEEGLPHKSNNDSPINNMELTPVPELRVLSVLYSKHPRHRWGVGFVRDIVSSISLEMSLSSAIPTHPVWHSAMTFGKEESFIHKRQTIRLFSGNKQLRLL
jgi:hypothetical protein